MKLPVVGRLYRAKKDCLSRKKGEIWRVDDIYYTQSGETLVHYSNGYRSGKDDINTFWNRWFEEIEEELINGDVEA